MEKYIIIKDDAVFYANKLIDIRRQFDLTQYQIDLSLSGHPEKCRGYEIKKLNETTGKYE